MYPDAPAWFSTEFHIVISIQSSHIFVYTKHDVNSTAFIAISQCMNTYKTHIAMIFFVCLQITAHELTLYVPRTELFWENIKDAFAFL